LTGPNERQRFGNSVWSAADAQKKASLLAVALTAGALTGRTSTPPAKGGAALLTNIETIHDPAQIRSVQRVRLPNFFAWMEPRFLPCVSTTSAVH
jgi:hypothetical protein